MISSAIPLRAAAVVAAALLLSACPAKDEKGLDFTKTHRQALDQVKGLEKAVEEAAAKRADPAERP